MSSLVQFYGIGWFTLTMLAQTTSPEPIVRDYRITARLDSAATELVATARLTLAEALAAGSELPLRIPFAPPAAVRFRAVRNTTGGDAFFEVDSAGTAVAQMERAAHAIEVDYSIRIARGSDTEVGYHLLSEKIGSGWYPRVPGNGSSEGRFADYDVTLEGPSTVGIMTTGGLGIDLPSPAGWVRRHYRAEHVEDFAIAAGGGFVAREYSSEPLRVLGFYHPDHAEAFRQIADRTAEAADWYVRTYGFFPAGHMAVLQGHPRWGGGFPLANMFMVHLGNLREDYLAFITAHELGHYYWGLHVLGAQERLDWLVLALGIWSDQLYLAERGGRSLQEQWRSRGSGDWMLDYLTAVVGNREQRLGILREDEQPLGFDYNSLVRHGKGATGVYLQSQLLGQGRFLELQRRLLRDYRHRPLPVADFVALLEEQGVTEAAEFFETWQRGDARIDVTVRVVKRAGDSTHVELERTGPVSYPVEVVVTGSQGRHHHVMGARVRADTVTVAGELSAVEIDPSGVVPMWGSTHPGIRSLFLAALARERQDWPFLELARSHLAAHPEDHDLRLDLVRRLFELGEWTEVVRSAPTEDCAVRTQCQAGLYAARALGRVGRTDEARTRLDSLRTAAERHGFGRAWQNAWDGLTPAVHQKE